MNTGKSTPAPIESLYSNISKIIEDARGKVYRTANIEMIQAYWHIGKLIVEEEQKGEGRAEYGKALIKDLSKKLRAEYGKGFTESNLKYMRQFYNTYKKSHALRGELTWTHYRLLLKVEKEDLVGFI